MRVDLPLLTLLLAGCSPAPVADTPEPQPQPISHGSAEPQPQPTAGGQGQLPVLQKPGQGACKLDAPKLSEDSCKTDADCGVSAPCHAPACVAKAKSNPPEADTICTMSLECHTADANRCGCHEGFCALIPPSDP